MCSEDYNPTLTLLTHTFASAKDLPCATIHPISPFPYSKSRYDLAIFQIFETPLAHI